MNIFPVGFLRPAQPPSWSATPCSLSAAVYSTGYIRSYPPYLEAVSYIHNRPNVMVNTPASYSGGPSFKSRPRRQAHLMEVFRGFSQFLQANAAMVPSFRPRPIPTKSFQIFHHSLITLSSTLLKKRRRIKYYPTSTLLKKRRRINYYPSTTWRRAELWWQAKMHFLADIYLETDNSCISFSMHLSLA
jgi:hypothetical protein